MAIHKETIEKGIIIALEVIKVILQGVETFTSTNKQERKKAHAEDNHKNHKP
ncbi:hypothetical protein SAMN02745216_02136 [Desulfatibacillum alkenivorans DSM 16219]|jgi:hypothetical protein|uniref:Uncharacterized protein n=1 Tax=Desulfatibacillum alkenivorans DSM 16219 TaxID=1121393 RepID=A0A1M6LNF8_9BACT|nr:hypothetical protein [Desulfatibacillum alkenivorans]SHJ72728.1 hypothetical protein SAMN02745216_02136 [Desulfatibacillum alkenivorans DSM 16219]